MFVLMAFSGIILSIVEANGWFIVPKFCIFFCYAMSIFSIMIFSAGRGAAEGYRDKMKEENEKKVE